MKLSYAHPKKNMQLNQQDLAPLTKFLQVVSYVAAGSFIVLAILMVLSQTGVI